MLMSNAIFKNHFIEIALHEEVIHINYAPKLYIDLEIAKQGVAERLKISEGRTYPMCVDASNVIGIDEDALKYLSMGDAVKYISACSIIVTNQLTRILATTLIMVKRPPVVTRLFTNKESAVKWLEYYKYKCLN